MCIIIAKKAGANPVPRENLERAWDHNSHGGGVVFFRPGDDCAYIKKGIMDKDEFLKLLDRVNKKENSFIAHFRIMSKGKVCKANTHPFCYEHITFAHNGTLSGITPDGDKTDSETYGNAFFVGKTMNWIKASKDLIEFTLGYSKFAVMDNHNGEIFVLNAQRGKEVDGTWYSNESAFEPPMQPSSGYDYYKKSTNLVDTTTCATTSVEIENGAYDARVSDIEMARRYLGTQYWTPNRCGIYYDKTSKVWKYRSGGDALKPAGMSGIVYSREGFVKLETLDVKDIELITDKNVVEDFDPKTTKAYLFRTMQAELEDLKNKKEVEDINDSLNLIRAYWLCANTIHRMQGSGIANTLNNLSTLLFTKSFVSDVAPKTKGLYDFDDAMSLVEEDLEMFLQRLN